MTSKRCCSMTNSLGGGVLAESFSWKSRSRTVDRVLEGQVTFHVIFMQQPDGLMALFFVVSRLPSGWCGQRTAATWGDHFGAEAIREATRDGAPPSTALTGTNSLPFSVR